MDSNKAQKIIEDACLILKDSKKYRSQSKQRKKKQQQQYSRESQFGNADSSQGGSRAMKYSPMNSNDCKVSEYRSNISSSINLCDSHEDFIRSVQSSNDHREKIKRPTTYCMVAENTCRCNDCSHGMSFANNCYDCEASKKHPHKSNQDPPNKSYETGGDILTDTKRLDRLKIRNLCLYGQKNQKKLSPHYYQGLGGDRRVHLSDNKCNLNPRPMTQANFQSSKFDASPKSGKQRNIETNAGMGRGDGNKLQHPFAGRETSSSKDKIFEERRPDNLLRDERFCTFKQSKVPKECSLSSFLQSDHQHDKERFWPASITSYKTDPIGKPFGSQYRLDGLLLEDFKFKSSQHFEIPKYIRHGNQVAGNEAGQLRSRKKGVRPTTDQIIGVGVNQRRF